MADHTDNRHGAIGRGRSAAGTSIPAVDGQVAGYTFQDQVACAAELSGTLTTYLT